MSRSTYAGMIKPAVPCFCSLFRPHMRAFTAHVGFFITFFHLVRHRSSNTFRDQHDLGLTKQEVWTSSIVGKGSTIVLLHSRTALRLPMALDLFAIVLCAVASAWRVRIYPNGGSVDCALYRYCWRNFRHVSYWTSRLSPVSSGYSECSLLVAGESGRWYHNW
jgi:hypothetical protein